MDNTNIPLAGYITLVIITAFLIFIYIKILPTIKNINKRVHNLLDKGVSKKKKPVLSTILSILIGGSGQFYNGEKLRGISYFILVAFTWHAALDVFPESKPGFLFWGISSFVIQLTIVYDAYRMAVSLNNAINSKEKATQQKCPFCAEIIKKEAIVCKHCGRNI